jgi:Protein of unknown function (DUF2934)
MNFIRPTEAQIRQRAHEIFLRSGNLPGHDVDNWLQAEYELMQLPVRKIAELEPAKTNRGNPAKVSLVNIIRTAVLLGVNELSHR